MNQEPSKLWIIIQNSFITLLIVMVVVILLLVITMALYRIYKLFYLKKLSEDQIEVVSLFEEECSREELREVKNLVK